MTQVHGGRSLGYTFGWMWFRILVQLRTDKLEYFFQWRFIQSSLCCSKQDRCLSLLGQKYYWIYNAITSYFMGGILLCFLCFSYRVPPLLQRPIVKCDAYNEDNIVSTFTKKYNEVFLLLCFLFLEPKSWRPTSSNVFKSIHLLTYLVK